MKQRRVDLELLRTRWLEGKTGPVIARELGCSIPYVSAMAKELGLPGRNKRQFTKALPGLEELVASGMTVELIADRLGASETTVYRRMEVLGLRRPGWADLPEKPEVVERREPVIDLSTVTGRLLATKGRWSALAEVAAAQGWTSKQAQQRYHAAVRGGA